MQNLPFFLLPFFLFCSVVTNALGYYLFLFLYPLIIVLKRRIAIPVFVKQISAILFAMYICFSLTNFLNLWFPNTLMTPSFYSEHFRFLKMLKSRLPVPYIMTALLLLVLYYASKWNVNNTRVIPLNTLQTKNKKRPLKPLESFFKGSLYASIFFGFVFLCEYIFKIHYRDVLHTLSFTSDPNLQNQMNRPTGLLANPLTLASMSLACFTFFYTYFCRLMFLHDENNSLPFEKNNKQLILYTFIPAMIFLFILFLTLARTAIMIAFIALVFIPFFSTTRKNFLKVFFLVLILFIFGYIICHMLGYVERVLLGFKNLNQSGQMDNRKFFREIYMQMFLDKPFIGNGNYWLNQGVRDRYFVLLGYADLNERNYPAHNTYLELLASGGILCALIVGYGIFKLGRIFKTYLMNRSFYNYTIWVAFTLCFIVNLGHAFTQNNFLEASTTYVYLYLFFIIFWEKYLTQKN